MDTSYDQMTVDELIAAALSEDNNDYWDYVWAMQRRGTHEVFKSALELCESEKKDERELGVDVLAQLGTPEKPFAHESVDILLDMLTKEDDEDMLNSIITALGHLEDPRAIEPVAQFCSHPSDQLRKAVACCMGHYNNDSAIDVLIELSGDNARDVRDWATFDLAIKEEIDTPQVREALWKRADDEDAEIRAEALLGLAYRKDARVVEPLIRELLTEDEVCEHNVEAAKEIADPRLYPVLNRLRSFWDIDVSLLEDAIDACRGNNIEDESQVEWAAIERINIDNFTTVINSTLKDKCCIDTHFSLDYSWLTIEFNDDISAQDGEKARLIMWNASWSISDESCVIVSSRNLSTVGASAVKCLIGKRVNYFRLAPKSKILKIGFDCGLLLKISPSASANNRHNDAWSFFSFETKRISMWCNGMIYRDREFSEEDSTEENGG